MSTETHYGPSPYHAGQSLHKGRREDCSFPDCHPETVLWAVHVKATDDVLAMADKTSAEAQAAQINGAGVGDVVPNASVTPWPYSPEGHARSLAQLAEDGGYWP